jgi:drug/metabolite transporter (DMT)-like permease
VTDRFRNEILLLVTAGIWGFAFVAQRAGMEHVGPFTFNGIRFALGSLALLPLLLFRRKRQVRGIEVGRRLILRAAGLAGIVLFAGASLQQAGIVYTSAGKAGFITGLYVVLVPILGLALGARTGTKAWIGALLAVLGLYLLSVRDVFTIALGDLLVLLGAFFWAAHVLVIGRFSPRIDVLRLASLQFAVCSILSLFCAALFESPRLSQVFQASVPILYAGLLSTGVAYTLQVAAQRKVPPTQAGIIMSLESAFAALGGWVMLRETFSARGLLGAALMLGGMMVSQLGRGRGGMEAEEIGFRDQGPHANP